MSNNRSNHNGCTTALALIILGIIAMPIFGLWLMSQPNEKDKITGKIMTVIGSVLWIVFFIITKLS